MILHGLISLASHKDLVRDLWKTNSKSKHIFGTLLMGKGQPKCKSSKITDVGCKTSFNCQTGVNKAKDVEKTAQGRARKVRRMPAKIRLHVTNIVLKVC